jgi:hypothetical protein
VTAPTPGQVAYEARQVAKGRRMGAADDTPDSEILAVIALTWDELPASMQADEEAGAQAVLTSAGEQWTVAEIASALDSFYAWFTVVGGGARVQGQLLGADVDEFARVLHAGLESGRAHRG